MTLYSRCIKEVAKPNVIEKYKNQLELIPANAKNELLSLLCKRAYIKDISILRQLLNPTVTVIDLSECEVTSDILSCLYVCKHLQKLDLSLRRRQARHISTEVLTSLFPHLSFLKIIAIPHCKEVNDEVIGSICESCAQLKELHIPNSTITDHSLYLIGQSLNTLSVINILGTGICDKGIQYLVNSPLSTRLTEINIDKCPNVSAFSSIIIAEKCPNLQNFTCGSLCDDEELSLAMNGIRSKAKQVFWSI